MDRFGHENHCIPIKLRLQAMKGLWTSNDAQQKIFTQFFKFINNNLHITLIEHP